ncbi:hypothetical protein RHMOL_Rhmol08G0012400 [Rhododendron molle]|uniref:Uncharacterized protein n=1 Tax=Rhododendron molle TaxID=49168 RepID=A0ACC0MJZ2_RHOML|nr:hypothetical protein RHMOL_Rhmol08G0012400 [Rhododendron molle]
MAVSQHLTSFSCELRITRVKNVDHLIKSSGQVFVRCYLSAGNNTRVRLETLEISSKSNLFFNYSLSLNCSGPQDSTAKLMESGTAVFELRQRKVTRPFLGKVGSDLLARAEVPWKSVFESPEMEIERWVFMVPKRRRGNEDEKPPAVEVAMKIRVPAVAETVATRRTQYRRERKWDECGCELRITRVKNIDYLIKSSGQVFVRCYLSAGNNTRVRLETLEISSKSNLFFNYSLSLNCSGPQDSMAKLMESGTAVFELRQRKVTRPFLGKVGSDLLAKAEVPWKSVFESPEMEIERWVFMVPKSRRGHEDEKPPVVEVAMKIGVPAVAETVATRRGQYRRERKWDECGCVHGGGCSCGANEIFALAAAL